MAKPKLCLIPSGVADNQVFSVLPSNGDGDFNFTRGTVSTRVNSQGLIETVSNDLPRLNYPLIDGVISGCPSLLLENSATNSVTYSEDFSNSSWLTTGLIVSGGGVSPDGTLNSKTITNTSPSGIIQKAVSLTGARVLSVFAKKGTHRYLYMGGYGGTNSYVNFDLENGTVSNGNGNIENYGNGWYRCICLGIDGTTGGVQIFPSNNSVGNSTTTGSIQIYGCQLEQSYATSYIPTTTQQETRLAETCNGAGTSDTFSDSEGVLMVEMSALANDGTDRVLSLSDGSANNRIVLYYNSSNNLVAQVYSISNNLQGTITVTDLNITENSKVSVKYETSSIKLYLNGFLKGTQSIAVSAINLSELDFDNGVGGADFYGNTKQLQYFDTTLTDSELETLTSWVSFQEMAEGQLYSVE